MTATPRSIADVWSVSNNVQRVAWMTRARQSDAVIAEHSKKDWLSLPPTVHAALMGVK